MLPFLNSRQIKKFCYPIVYLASEVKTATQMAAEQRGNFTTNNVTYVGGVAQLKTTTVSTSQPAEYEAFRAKKASELSNFLHNPYVDYK